jgi:superfamily II DNA/RNA helicase
MEQLEKKQGEILEKLGIDALNPMQMATADAFAKHQDLMLLSPTGSGKTLAILLPLVAQLHPATAEVHALIITPTRELSLQIEQVCRSMGTGLKVNAAYGGRSIVKDREELQHLPEILIGTPGRIADHIGRESFDPGSVQYLILDEFDKSLEIGFAADMQAILSALPNLKKRVLTSATQGISLPPFLSHYKPFLLNFSGETPPALKVQLIHAPNKDKLPTLLHMVQKLQGTSGIIFCNFKETIDYVSEGLAETGIRHECFHGGLDQRERERALIKFRNGSSTLLLATDLAARGIDVPELGYIIHFQLPLKAEEFTHRNGRTARMQREGTAYVLHTPGEAMPDFIQPFSSSALFPEKVKAQAEPHQHWSTLFISGGRRDKISKGDIAGFLMKQGGLEKNQLGLIELKHDCAFVAIDSSTAQKLLPKTDNQKLKGRKVRVYLV